MRMQLDRRFYAQAKGVFEKYMFDVGILDDGVHKEPLSQSAGLRNFKGGPARKRSRITDGTTLSEVSESLRSHLGVNFYQKPFRSRKNRAILRFSKSFFDLVRGKSQKKRCENLLQAIVRNPILRGDYGQNSDITRKIKGFSRLMIDTGQFFNAIKAKVRRSRVSK